MKINKTDKIIPIYENMSLKKVKFNKRNNDKDGIEISEKAKDYQFALSKLKEVPEMRMEKVNKIKKEIESGTYNVEGKEIVDKMYEYIDFHKRI